MSATLSSYNIDDFISYWSSSRSEVSCIGQFGPRPRVNTADIAPVAGPT